MPQKEVQVNKKWYWELEQKNEIQVFMGQPPAFFSDDNIAYYRGKLVCCFKNGVSDTRPFIDDLGNVYAYCALLSSEHEKKSRRCTAKELSKWVLGGNGFWLDRDGLARTLGDFNYTKPDDECGKIVISICTWDGEPMEPTAQNMGLPESK